MGKGRNTRVFRHPVKYGKILKILNFVEYTASENQDLWCHPIISVSDKQYALLTSALAGPVILRVVEHWFVSLNLELQDKGFRYEELILNGVNNAIKTNPKIVDYDKAISRRIKLTNSQEEIDLILRIGNIILIGEAKSIVTTDSPISNYRTIETLKHAAEQVERKTEFVKNNLPCIFDNLNWDHELKTEYIFLNFIVNSGRMHVGFDINGIPVIDEKILIKYFSESKIPLASIIDVRNGNTKHIAWHKLYDNFDDLKNNLDAYLRSPPQIFKSIEQFEYNDSPLPCIDQDSYKIIFRRLISREVILNDRVELDHYFPIEKSVDYETEIKQVSIVV